MSAPLAIRRRPYTARAGTLVCTKCGATRQLALWEGGVCRRCHRPRRINLRYTATPARRQPQDRGQTPETLRVRGLLEAELIRRSLSLHRFCEIHGLVRTSVANWYRGEQAALGQHNTNRKILAALGVEQ